MELTIGTLIKIIIGIFVIVIVIIGVYFFFRNYVIDFFRGGEVSADFFLALLK